MKTVKSKLRKREFVLCEILLCFYVFLKSCICAGERERERERESEWKREIERDRERESEKERERERESEFFRCFKYSLGSGQKKAKAKVDSFISWKRDRCDKNGGRRRYFPFHTYIRPCFFKVKSCMNEIRHFYL